MVIEAIRVTIRNALPEKLRAELLMGTLAEAPVETLAQLTKLSEDSSDTAHRRLEAKAKDATLTVGQEMTEYVTEHMPQRRKMLEESYPKIEDDKTSVRMAVKGLDTHPTFKAAAKEIRLSGIPNPLKILEDRLLEEERYYERRTDK